MQRVVSYRDHKTFSNENFINSLRYNVTEGNHETKGAA